MLGIMGAEENSFERMRSIIKRYIGGKCQPDCGNGTTELCQC